MDIENLYAEEIISNYEHPHNKRKMENPTASFEEHNPVCGDDITIYVKLESDKIKDISFEGSGCAISIGTASILTENVKGKSIKDVEKMDYKSIVEMIGIDPGPARMKCATVALNALQKAIKSKKE
ncbi:MAG: Fe-S cluster assembly sulfur transfer protein SufU [Candidatus Micrarchaeia archaeon]